MAQKNKGLALTFDVGEFMLEDSVQDMARYASDRFQYQRDGTPEAVSQPV